MIDLIPREIIREIFKNLSLKELIKNEIICKNFRHIIRTTKWDHFVVKLKYTNAIKYVGKNYKFTKYDFSNSLITDDIVKLFVNCHTLIFSECKQITDESAKLLGNCHKLKLCNCDQITDERNYNKQSLL
jgi:hypothetical protein